MESVILKPSTPTSNVSMVLYILCCPVCMCLSVSVRVCECVCVCV